MRQHTIALILLAVYFLGTLRPYTPYLEYSLNKSYIASVLCENKDLPVMNCDGNCYLMKQIKRYAGKSEDSPVPPAYDFEKNFVHILAEVSINLSENSDQKSTSLYVYQGNFTPVYLELSSPPPKYS